jgi:hypothetical protein
VTNLTILSLVLLAAAPAIAQTAAEASSSVSAYPASFFEANHPTTAYDMISRLPGFSFYSGSQVRGFADAGGNVLIDGRRPTSKSDDLYSILARIPADQVERIDLIRGSTPGIDMQGYAMVANIIQKKTGGQQGALTFESNYAPGRGLYMPIIQLDQTWKKGERSLSVSFLEGRGVNPFANGQHSRLDGAGSGGDCLSICHTPFFARSSSVWGKAEAVLNTPLAGGKMELHANINWGQNLYLQAESAATPELTDRLRSSDANAQGELGASYEWKPSKATTVTLIGLYQASGDKGRQSYLSDSLQLSRQNNRYSESIGRVTVQHKHSDLLSVKLEGELAYNFQTSGTRYSNNGVFIPVPAGMTRVDEVRFDGGATASWTLSPKLSLDTGLRYESSTLKSQEDVNQSETVTYWKPKLMATWKPDGPDQVRFNLERSVSQTDFSAFTTSGYLSTGLRAGNPTLTPQSSWDVSLTFERSFGDSGDVTLSLTHSDLDRTVDYGRALVPRGAYSSDSDYYGLPANLGHGVIDGVNLSFTLPLRRLGLPNAQIKWDGGWEWSRVTDPSTGQGRPISNRYPVYGNVTFIYDQPKIGATTTLGIGLPQKVTQYRFDEIDQTRTPLAGYFSYERKLSANWKATLAFNNIADGKWVRTYQVFQASRPSPLYSLDERSQGLHHTVALTLRRSWP